MGVIVVCKLISFSQRRRGEKKKSQLAVNNSAKRRFAHFSSLAKGRIFVPSWDLLPAKVNKPSSLSSKA